MYGYHHVFSEDIDVVVDNEEGTPPPKYEDLVEGEVSGGRAAAESEKKPGGILSNPLKSIMKKDKTKVGCVNMCLVLELPM